VPGGDLNVAQAHPSVEHGRDKCVPEHVWMRPADPHSRLLRESPQPPGGGVPVHACPMDVEQDRSRVTAGGCAVDGAAGRWWQGTRTTSPPLPQTRSTR
jgi:hypothetical protein